MSESESETEDEIIARIEAALQKIAAAGKRAPRDGIDGPAVARALDTVIGRLQAVLEPAEAPKQEAAQDEAPPNME